MMKRLTKKQVEKIQTILEENIGMSALAVKTDGDLICLYFPDNIKIQPIITEMRSDLDEQGFYFFHSKLLYKEIPVTSFNIIKQ